MKLGQDEKRRDSVCWNKDAHAQSLRVELADGSFHVFPYSRVHFARFECAANQDTLHVSLETHEIQITGQNLRELGLALQKFAVDWVKELPARQSPVTDDDRAWIKSIAVKEIER